MNRPGNYWSYLLICALAVLIAHAKAMPIGQYVSSVFQQVIDGLKLAQDGGASGAPGEAGRDVLPLR